MGTYNPNEKPTYNLLRGLRGLYRYSYNRGGGGGGGREGGGLTYQVNPEL